MSLFLTILSGDTPATAEPVLATRDQYLIDIVVQGLLRRLGVDESTRRVLKFPATEIKDRSDLSSEEDPDGS